MLSEKLKTAVGGSASTLYVDDVFSTWLYTGNGSTQTITNGIDLAGNGGLVWGAIRSGTIGSINNVFTDTARGVTPWLSSVNTNAQNTAGNDITSFNSNGFSLNYTSGLYNSSGNNMVSWTFRKYAKFFDVQTISHTNGTANNIDLSVLGTVGTVMAKITTTTGDWCVWHRSLTAANNLVLNTTAAQSTTNAYLSVSGTTATLSASAPTGTYVIYAWAHDTTSTGIIQCGSVSASGVTNVSLGFEPQYVLLRSVGVGSWFIIDTMRGFSDSDEVDVRANVSSAEASRGANVAYPTATGFVFDAAQFQGTNTYIYIAIRRPNKPPTSGTQVFSPITYTGNGTDPRNITGFGFPIDLMIQGYRNQVAGCAFYDRLRGAGYYLSSSSSGAETNGVLAQPSFALQDGDQVAAGNNTSGNLFIQEGFKRAPTFFDVVCYTGAPTAFSGRSIPHNLGVTPELAIFKARSAASTSWSVGGFNNCDGTGLILNTTAAFNGSGPLFGGLTYNTGTSMYIRKSTGAAYDVDASGVTYVAYLFATLAGVSKVGSYTGNGTTQTINCGFSTGARFVLIKRTDAAGDWYTFDTARGMTTLTDPYLLLNSTAAETATLGAVTTTSVGFALNSAILAAINVSAGTYIYLAIS